jgi:alginate biosynthesis protein AlgX
MLIRSLLVFGLATLLSAPAMAFEVCAAAKDPSAYVATDRWAVIAEQGKEGWIFARGELLQPADLGPSVHTLTRLAAALREAGTLPVLVPVPSRLTLAEDKLDPAKKEFQAYKPGTMSSMYARHIKAMRTTGWEVLDLVTLAQDTKLGAEFFNDKDHHWSTQGARVTAGAVAAAVKKSPFFAGVTKKAFTLTSRDVRNPGSYRWVVLDRCGIEIPAEVTKSYSAESAEEVSADSLLGDEASPEIVLIGTSQSRRQDFDALGNRQYFEDSFSALLRSELQADVLNLAAAGGGTFTAVDGLLTSREFQKNKPKVLIWEMNNAEGFDEVDKLRTLVPAVYGRCSKSDAIVSVTGSGNEPIELAVPAGTKVMGNRYYLSVKLSDTSIVSFQVTFNHGGSKDGVPVGRSPLLPNSGLYFVEVSGAIKKPLSSVNVTLPAGANGRWDARLCEAK